MVTVNDKVFKVKIISLAFLLLAFFSCAHQNNSSNQLFKDKSPEENRADIYFQQGLTDLNEKNYIAALKNLTEAKNLSPKNDTYLVNLAMAYYFRHENKLAEEELLNAIKINPENADARLNLSFLYLNSNRYALAKKELSLILKNLTYPHLAEAHYNLGLIALKEGDHFLAVNEFNQSVYDNNQFCLSHFKLGEINFEETKYNDALTSFNNATKGTCYNFADAHFKKAMTYLKLDQPIKAREILNFMNEKFTNDPIKNKVLKKLAEINRNVPFSEKEQIAEEIKKKQKQGTQEFSNNQIILPTKPKKEASSL